MPKTVLLIHNDGAKAKRLTEALFSSSAGYFCVEWVKRCAEAEKLLRQDREEPIGVILVNLFLRDSQGLETFDRVFGLSADTPILVISSADHRDAAELAVKRGARNYLLEDLLDSHSLPKELRKMLEHSSNADTQVREKESATSEFDSGGDAVVCADALGNVTFFNPTAEALTGWTASEAVGRPFAEIFPLIDALDQPCEVDPMAFAVETNTPMNLPEGSRVPRRDGNESAIEASIAPIHDRRGRVTGGVMVFTMRSVGGRNLEECSISHDSIS